jgi:hypothetical protein
MHFGNACDRLQHRRVETQTPLHLPSEHWLQEPSDGSKVHDKTVHNGPGA